jgi:hypothetical protein
MDEPISFRLPGKMYKELKRAAEREYLSISQYLRKLIREAMAKEKP